ncbi:TPA: hypothetical protein ACVO4A_000778 [Vibrio diabolicus]
MSKKEIDLKNEYEDTSSKRKVIHCRGAIRSYDEATKSLLAAKKKTMTRGLILQIERLARGERMSKENFAPEGNLPNKSGGKKFYALKRIPIRGYCWQSSKNPKFYYISHYISKDFKKLRPKDTNIVGNNWERIEENNDEC